MNFVDILEKIDSFIVMKTLGTDNECVTKKYRTKDFFSYQLVENQYSRNKIIDITCYKSTNQLTLIMLVDEKKDRSYADSFEEFLKEYKLSYERSLAGLRDKTIKILVNLHLKNVDDFNKLANKLCG